MDNKEPQINVKGLEKDYRDFLEKLPLTSLRTLARSRGVKKATAKKKDELVEEVLDVLMDRGEPEYTNRGAPPKNADVDLQILGSLADIKLKYDKQPEIKYQVSSPNYKETTFVGDLPLYKGILEIMNGGYGFLRAKNCRPSSDGSDVFIPANLISEKKLRVGDYVTCTAQPRQKSDSPAIDYLGTVNGSFPGEYEDRPHFEALTAKYANEKFSFSENSNELALRILDLFIPIGKGQRGLIIAPPKAGKTTLLKQIAGALYNRGDVQLVILLIDERPEEVTDFRENMPRARIISSTFDEISDRHIHAAELALEHAKRLVEMGKDVVLLLDSLTKLTRAFNNATESTGKTLSGGLDSAALGAPKRFFGAARNTVEKGSLTILATVLVDTGSRMDDIIYEEFKGSGNADIYLSRDYAERRIYPSIDIRRSGTRREELLLSPEELTAVYEMRERGLCDNAAGVIKMMKRTKNNAEFISRLPEWLKIYKA